MKKLLITLSFLVSGMVFGLGARIPSSGSSPTIPTTYAADDANSEALTCGNSNVIKIYNDTAGALAVGMGSSTSAPINDYDFCPAGTGTVCVISVKGGAGNNTTIYIRSDTGSAISSGVVRVACLNEETP